jgi:hypothetical protein
MLDELSFRRMVNRLKRELFPFLERKVYNEKVASLKIMKEGKPVMYLIYDKSEHIPWWYLEQLGEIVECKNLLDEKTLPVEEVKITSNYWTCECENYFIHHKVQMECPICKFTVAEDTKILNILKGT